MLARRVAAPVARAAFRPRCCAALPPQRLRRPLSTDAESAACAAPTPPLCPAAQTLTPRRVRARCLSPRSFEDARAFFATPVPARGKAYGRHARAIMEELEQEQVALRSARRKYELPEINSGDVVKVTYYESLTDKAESSFQGIVLGLFNKGVMQSVELRNVVDGVPLVRPPPNPNRLRHFLGWQRAGQPEAGEGNRRRQCTRQKGERGHTPLTLSPSCPSRSSASSFGNGQFAQELRIPLLSPLVKEVTVLSERQKVMRHKLYYLRDRCAPLPTPTFPPLVLALLSGNRHPS